jgi:hypothetical protein
MPSETQIYSVMSGQFGGVSLVFGCGSSDYVVWWCSAFGCGFDSWSQVVNLEV